MHELIVSSISLFSPNPGLELLSGELDGSGTLARNSCLDLSGWLHSQPTRRPQVRLYFAAYIIAVTYKKGWSHTDAEPCRRVCGSPISSVNRKPLVIRRTERFVALHCATFYVSDTCLCKKVSCSVCFFVFLLLGYIMSGRRVEQTLDFPPRPTKTQTK